MIIDLDMVTPAGSPKPVRSHFFERSNFSKRQTAAAADEPIDRRAGVSQSS
jgi:hypothetical protein